MGIENYIVQASQVFFLLGYLLFFAVIFAESGLFFGFFLPGDSLIFSLGLLASQGILNIWLVLIVGIFAAISGDSVGYWFGRKFGPNLFKKEDGLLFKKENLIKAQVFYEKYGVKTIILARFTPIVRTFAPIVAGAAKMKYTTFLTYNIIGGIGWITSMTVLGYFLGRIIPNIEKYILLIIGAIILISLIPAISHLRKNKS